MSLDTLISAEEAVRHVADLNWVFVDCRFYLNDAERAFREYQAMHIKGAVYAHLNRDLSGPVEPGKTGRHPLPSEQAISRTFSMLGIDANSQVVAYDEAGGFMAAARLWWLLKWAGHDAVAVLNGGLKEWTRLGYPTSTGVERRSAKVFVPHFRPEMVLDTRQFQAALQDQPLLIVDSRTHDRYRGENETIDPVAGHIPHAVNAPFPENLEPAGTFKSREDLGKRFDALMGQRSAEQTVFYCGSGVTAAHNVLACSFAGKGIPRLYAGSWSEWITDPARPIATGE